MQQEPLSEILGRALYALGCQTGTIHQTTAEGQHLALICQMGVPPQLHDRIALIPFGKGMAGAAAASREPVELCNLQQDLGGVAKVEARRTGVSGSIAVPFFSTADGEVMGTLGVGMATPHDFTEEEKEVLAGFALEVVAFLENAAP